MPGKADDESVSPHGYIKRSANHPPKLWESARRAAALITARTGREVTINDLQRWGLHRQVQAVANGDYDAPEGYKPPPGAMSWREQ